MVDAIALGCGLVGNFVVQQLAERDLKIHVVDLVIPDSIKLHSNITFDEGDIFKIKENLPNSNLIINMLPGRIGESMRELFILEGKDIVDLAFTEEDPTKHHQLAVENKSTVIWDVGIAPGLSNMIMKMEFGSNEIITEATIKVGGNPSKPDDEWSYMAPFSPSDVIEEYTRPARIIDDNGEKTVPALTDLHKINVEGYGTMEAFLTDGLRSLLYSGFSQSMREYTVRWPGHIEKWLETKENYDEGELIEAWKFDSERDEFTWMEICIKNQKETIQWIICDNGKDGHSSMARTTGLVTMACVLEFINPEKTMKNNLGNGVFSPEKLSDDSIERIIRLMKGQGVEICRNII